MGRARRGRSVLLVHGLGEHSGRYEHVGDQLTAAGIDAWAYDHRGNGGSGGRRGHVERWSQLHDDLAERLAVVRGRVVRAAVVLYGHSLGGLIAAGYVLAGPAEAGPAVLSAPGAGRRAPGLEAFARRRASLGGSRPTLRIPNGLDGSTAVARPVGRGEDRRRPALRQDQHRPVRGGGVRRAGPGPRGCVRRVRRSRRWSSTARTTGSSRPRRRRSSRACPASNGGPTRSCATSSTTSRRGRRSSTRSSPGSRSKLAKRAGIGRRPPSRSADSTLVPPTLGR